MRFILTASTFALAASALAAPAASAQQIAANNPQLDEITVTSQRREVGVQDTSAAVTALSGESLEKDRVLSFEDVASRATSLSFTALSPLDQEFNIRGITNTRLDSPSADQSVGIFVDEVYIGRSGLFNFDMFDIERVEVIRGPQGVLLGRNVVGGAISIITAEPDDEFGGNISASYGNYEDWSVRGHITGPITPELLGRFSFYKRKHAGYAQDILHGRDLEDLDSIQFRGQLLWQPENTDFSARLIVDYTNDDSNGFLSVAIDGPGAGQGPWSAARDAIGVLRGEPLSLREGLPEHPRYKGEAEDTPQQLEREAWGVTLHLNKGVGGFATLQSRTGYRTADGFNVYDQTGMGPNNGYGVLTPTLFRFPVNEREEIDQFTQEVRLVSDLGDSRFDWIVGAYFQRDSVNKVDRFWAEVPAAIPTLSGESQWNNEADNTSYAGFAQIGFKPIDMVRLVGGVRYSHDKKEGTVTGLAVETGDAFHPADPVALTPLAATFLEGESFTTDYSDTWSEVTPQGTIEFTPAENAFFYFTYAKGYKGGGFEDDPANAAAAAASYDPETARNLELGAKLDFFDRRARLNIALFDIRYQDLQVTQTDDGCLCNITDNAADAKIRGVEVEAQLAATDNLTFWGGVTYLDTEYIEFIDSTGLDASGNFLQRTPKYQFNIGAEWAGDLGPWENALLARVNYNRQGMMFWAPDNAQTEDPFGLLDARVAITPPGSRVTLSAYGRNLLDTVHRTNIIAFFGDEVSRLAPPRTYGVELSFDF
ncbi:MAG: TonB-dependent receptor [Pseudomonadota bacterium]|nr:TonB-dependent receptor [Pseudomonadota bacterium]